MYNIESLEKEREAFYTKAKYRKLSVNWSKANEELMKEAMTTPSDKLFYMTPSFGKYEREYENPPDGTDYQEKTIAEIKLP